MNWRRTENKIWRTRKERMSEAIRSGAIGPHFVGAHRKLVHSPLFYRGRHRNVPRIITHVQSHYSAHLTFCLAMFPMQFSSTLRQRDLKTRQSPAISNLWKRQDYRNVKSSFSKGFLSTRKHKASVLRFLRFAKHFQKAPFSWRISVDGRPNQRNKTPSSNSSGVVWT